MERNGDQILVKAPLTSFNKMGEVPGAVVNAKERTWTLPLTWASCVVMRGIFGSELDVGVDLASWVQRERSTRLDLALQLREMEDLPESQHRPLLPGMEHKPWQCPGTEFLMLGDALLGDDMRLGKTAEIMAAIKHMGSRVLPFLILAPPNVKRVWGDHFERWLPEANVQVPKPGLAAAEKAIKAVQEGESQGVVLHYEIIPLVSRLVGYGSEKLKACKDCLPGSNIQASKCHIHKKILNQVKFKLVVADEVHRISEPGVQTRAVWAVSREADIRWGSTGTLPAEDPDRFWCIFNFISPQEFPVKGKFRDRYANVVKDPWTGFEVSKDWREDRREELEKIYLPRYIRRTKRMVHDFKEPERILLQPEMTPKQAAAYKQLKNTLMAEVEGGIFWTDSPLQKMGRLRQLASAYGELTEEVDEEGKIKVGMVLAEPSSKLDALEDYLENTLEKDSAAVIMAEQKQLIELAATRLGGKATKLVGNMTQSARDRAIDDFQEGRVPYILCTTASGGEGIKLDRADTMIVLQTPWSRITNEQMEDRHYMEGRVSLIVSMITPGTVDEKVPLALEEKNQKYESLIRDKEMLKKWLT